MTTGQNVRCSSIYLLCTMVLLFLVCGPALQFWLLAPCYGVFSSIMKQCVSPTCTREQTAPAARGPFSRAVCQQLTAGFCCNSCYLNAMHPLVAESLHIMPHGGHCSGPASWLSGDDANGGNRNGDGGDLDEQREPLAAGASGAPIHCMGQLRNCCSIL